MANWSQSELLQAIGWAIVNSIWQMAFLWCLYLLIVRVFSPSSNTKYTLAVSSLLGGALWSFYSFISFKVDGSAVQEGMASVIGTGDIFISNILSAASMAYLGLLVFPAYNLVKNYRYVTHIKTKGIKKAELQYRLFVKNIAARLDIKKKVSVFVSDLITSPLTIGYLKPVILLPVAALNHLSVQQVEAILLHELSHIRRLDYLVNLFLNVISTVFYFNPFVKQFMKAIDEERENCCDELVLQFQYDKVGYATALFTLEKISSTSQALAIAATGKNSLKKRIEKMAGMENKNQFSFRQVAGLLAAFFFIVAFNSIIIVKSQQKTQTDSIVSKSMVNPFLFMPGEDQYQQVPVEVVSPATDSRNIASSGTALTAPASYQENIPADFDPAPEYRFVAGDDVESSLSTEQKEQVNSTVKATKKIMKSQWKEIETQIGEVMTTGEKAIAKQEYNEEIEKLNWDNIERNLKSKYQTIDWITINGNVSEAMTTIQLDSMYATNKAILKQLELTEKEIAKAKCSATAIPDASVQEILKMKTEVKVNLNRIQNMRERKVIRL